MTMFQLPVCAKSASLRCCPSHTGETKEYIYPNQRASTSWYHDHALHITLENAYHGLAGMYIMSDKIKNGGCGEPYNLEVRCWACT
jgi:FtsP/CotA-like multicopper oxidase with cupredoxin domain